MTASNHGFPQLFVTDLDGTALGGDYQPYARFPDPFSEFLDRLAARGCQWAISTTWDVGGQWQLVLASAVRSRPAYHMAEMGCRVARGTPGGPEFIQPYTADTEARVAAVNQSHLYPLMNDVCGRFKPLRMNFYGHWFDFAPHPDEQDRFLAHVRSRYADSEALTVMIGGGMVAHARFLEKGRGLREVLRLSGISPDRVVVAGDSMGGDGTMIQPGLARYGVCPGNADPALKEHIRAHGGAVGEGPSSRGVIQAFGELARRNGWDF
jgi:hydroxymethylpyrimidine pyrophosphatase-like HAD family hydrolase